MTAAEIITVAVASFVLLYGLYAWCSLRLDDINAPLAADVAEREEFTAAWNADGTLQSVGGLTADEFLARVKPDVQDSGAWGWDR